MPIFSHVLVATDLSVTSWHALQSAADLASRLGARLTVLHVVTPRPYPYPVPPSDRAIEDARSQLADEVASLGGGAEAMLREGSPAEGIVSAARDIGADLVVVGSRGDRGARRALLGSVAEHVMRLSPVPVLTVHPWRFENRDEAARALEAATSHLRAVSPAVIAISRGALVIAAAIGRRFDEAPDLLLATSVGRDGALFGGICEEGTVCLAPEELERAPRDPARDVAFAKAQKLLAEESTALRGSHWIGDVWHRTVLVVADALDEPWSVLAACDVLRRHGASRLIVVTPVVTGAASATVERAVDQLIALYRTNDVTSGLGFYRDGRPIGLRAASRCLRSGSAAP